MSVTRSCRIRNAFSTARALLVAAVVAGAAVVLTAAAPAGAAGPGRWVFVVTHADRGPVAAVLTVERRRSSFGIFEYRKLHLRVTLSGRTVFDRGLCSDQTCGVATHHTLLLRNVWGDAVPEALLDSYSGGAHCCFGTTVVYLDGPKAGRSIFRQWGDPGYRLVSHDGAAQFVSADDRFAYTFTAFAASGLPVEVFALDAQGRFQDVTGSRLDLVRKDAKQWWKTYVRERGKPDADVRGVLGAWCGDEYRLGKKQACAAALTTGLAKGWLDGPSLWPRNAKYVVFVKRRLEKWGYGRPARG